MTTKEVPEKIYLVMDEGIRRWVLPNQVKHYPNAEIIEFIPAESLNSLANELEKEGNFLTSPDDHVTDRAVGNTYKECASRIREIIQEKKVIDK